MTTKKPTRMYPERKKNIGAVEGCPFGCKYCNFRKLRARFGKSEEDRAYKFHVHIDELKFPPPITKGDEFISIGLSSDISLASDEVIHQIIEYCNKWRDRLFLIQSKDPARFVEKDAGGFKFKFPDNLLVGTTIETNRDIIWRPATAPKFIDEMKYSQISQAPPPAERCRAMVELEARKFVTIEPIMDFDVGVIMTWLEMIAPEIVYIGYDSDPVHNKLPEPSLRKTTELITRLKWEATERDIGLTIRQKLLRAAWWE